MWCRSLRESLNARPSATGSTRPNSPSSSTHLPDVRSNVAGIWQYQSQQALGAWLARSCGRRNLVRWGLYPRPRQPGAAGPLPFRWSRYRGGFPTWWRQIPGRAGVPALQRRWPTGARLCAADLGPWGGSGLSEVGAAAQHRGSLFASLTRPSQTQPRGPPGPRPETEKQLFRFRAPEAGRRSDIHPPSATLAWPAGHARSAYRMDLLTALLSPDRGQDARSGRRGGREDVPPRQDPQHSERPPGHAIGGSLSCWVRSAGAARTRG